MLVVDAESTDGTAGVARARGASVIVRPWEGFVAARRFALAQVATPWAFMLDADEMFDPELRAAIEAAQPDAETGGYRVRRVTYLCGKPILAGGWGGERLVRLFRPAKATLEAVPAAGGDADIHERWNVNAAVRDLDGVLLHDSYPTLQRYFEKFARYTSLEARSLHASPLTLGRVVALAPARAAWSLVGRGGWRDGWRGAFVACASAAYPVAVVLKALRR